MHCGLMMKSMGQMTCSQENWHRLDFGQIGHLDFRQKRIKKNLVLFSFHHYYEKELKQWN